MSDLVSVLEFEEHAFKVLPRNALDYYRSGAGKQETLADNRKAFFSALSTAQALGIIYTLSTLSTSSIEEVAEAAPHAVKWYQLYIYRDRLANFQGQTSEMSQDLEKGSGLNNYVTDLFDATISWEDIKWLKSITRLPIVLKGILTAEDALLAVQAGVSAVQVSNHGARQIDGTPASIEALPEIVKAVGDKIEVYVDGGVTDGIDVLKAVALGAKMTFIGRPALWGLAHSGQQGVEKVLNILKNELKTAIGISGYSKISDVPRDLVVHESYYAKL
ncbi:unnamed protein product [Diabrotica balteata]|uniref:FMN hydroxy acid dehydrogenase domain-containing protein n=1 Tax=Diabrotica balteata TaxID=107213 RepID=A0A9N9SYF8_DIABA|nr:unnamed protein product [Diabrotica balteata]